MTTAAAEAIYSMSTKRGRPQIRGQGPTTELVLGALEHPIFTREREGLTDLSGLGSHNDAGSQYTLFAFTSRLLESGIDPSVGSVGDAHDNALAETTVGMVQDQADPPARAWRDAGHVELATFEWVDFFNTIRPHEYLDDLTPALAEALHDDRRKTLAPTG